MKLLPKSEIQKAKAAERKRDIDEGVKLAQRVDNLREVAVNEEKTLENFRVATLKRINSEIHEKERERDLLEFKNSKLRIEKEDLKKPLDEEWSRCKLFQKELDNREKEIDSREKAIKESEERVKQEELRVVGIIAGAISRENAAISSAKSASENEENAKKIVASVKLLEKTTKDKYDKMSNDLYEREINIAVRERDARVKEEGLIEKERDLLKEWKLLDDRKATLERHVNSPRNKNNKC